MTFQWLRRFCGWGAGLFKRRKHAIPTEIVEKWKDSTTPVKETKQTELTDYGLGKENQMTLDEWGWIDK